jgi:hypothetical protein
VAIIHQDHAVYYFPLNNSGVEHLSSLAFTPFGGPTYRPFVVGSGFHWVGNDCGLYTQNMASYPSPNGAQSLTLCVWVSGFAGNSPYMRFGWGQLGQGMTLNAIEHRTTPAGVSTLLYYKEPNETKRGVAIGYLAGPHPNISFLVSRIEFYGGTRASGWMSLNGAPWLAMNGVDCPGLAGTNPTIGFQNYTGPPPGGMCYDEICLWKDAPRFTDDELAHLYALGNTLKLPLTSFTDTFITAETASGTLDLVLHGAARVSGSLPLSITGRQYASGIVSAFVSGPVPTTDIFPQDSFTLEGGSATRLVGKTSTPATGTVNIEVWHLGPSGVSPVALPSSSCASIGDTGYWSWPLANLPQDPGIRPHYLYRMTGSDGGEYVAAFRLRHGV